MAFHWKNVVAAVALVGVTSALTAQVVSDKQKAPSPEEMMEAWLKLSQPGPEHAEMIKSAGTWWQESTHWMEPGAPPEVSTSKATLKPIMGGRFMLENMEGSMNFGGQEMPFEGLGIFGFDNTTKKHNFVWLDSMGTMMMTGTGTADATGKVITYHSEMFDPFMGEMLKLKSVSTVVNDNENRFEMFTKLPTGDWFQNMKIVAKRGR